MQRTLALATLLLAACSGGSGSSARSGGGAAPVISDLTTDSSASTLRVTWTTDVEARAELRYGTGPGLELGSVTRSSLARTHSLTLADLEPGTSYHLQPVATDAEGDVQVGQLLVVSTIAVPRVSFAEASMLTQESAGTVHVRVELDAPAGHEVRIPIETSGSAVEGEDYSLAQNPLVVPAGETWAEITIAMLDEAAAGPLEPEGVESAFLRLLAPEGAVLGEQVLHELRIEPLRAVVLGHGQLTASEGDGELALEVRLTALFEEPVQIPFVLGGSAVPGEDFQLLTPSPLVVPAGESLAHVRLAWIADGLVEGSEIVTVTLGQPSAGSLGTPGIATITLLDDDGPDGLTSDDFNGPNLDTTVWQFGNPLEDAHLRLVDTGTEEAALLLEVPQGTEHVVYDVLTSPHVTQPVGDEDFRIEVKFDSTMTAAYQGQGILAMQNHSSWMRFDVYFTGSSHRIFASAVVDGVPSDKINKTIPSPTGSFWMRVTRTGDQWVQEYSLDGSAWTLGAIFSHPMVVDRAGVFALNAAQGSQIPGFTARVDYVEFDTDPIALEDGGIPTDELPPLVHGLLPVRGHRSLQVVWATDEPATGEVHYGLTPACELGVIEAPALVHDQRVALADLEPGTTYHYRIVARDAGGRTTEHEVRSASTLPLGDAAPEIDVWYGAHQTFGAIGQPQQWVNVLGNVAGPGGVSWLTMSLNGAPHQVLSLGPNLRRLEEPGDFVVEIDFAELLPGTNELVLRAHHGSNLQITSEEVVWIEYVPGTTWPDAYTIDWGTLERIDQGAQVVDGKWTLDGDRLRMVEAGYDRLVAIGDQLAWDDYEVECTITMHGIEPVYTFPANPGPSVGFLLRWIGHQPTGNDQPNQGFRPLGTIACYQWHANGTQRLELQDDIIVAADGSGKTLDFEVPYVFKARVETGTPGSNGIYSFKVWEEGTPEPAEWDLVHTMSDDLETGSLLLLLHHAYASYGEVRVTPL